MPANLGRNKLQNPDAYVESYTDLANSATYPTNSITNVCDSTASNQWNYFCWQPTTTKQIGLNNAFPPVTLDGTANTANAYPIIIIQQPGLYLITAEVNVGLPLSGGATHPLRNILKLGKNYGTHYVKQATPPTGRQNSATNLYPITNRDNGTQSTLVPPTICLASTHFDSTTTAEQDGDDHSILNLTAVGYLQPGDDITLSLVLDQQSLNTNKANDSQIINSVQMQVVSMSGVNANAQTDQSMMVGVNPGYSYSTV